MLKAHQPIKSSSLGLSLHNRARKAVRKACSSTSTKKRKTSSQWENPPKWRTSTRKAVPLDLVHTICLKSWAPLEQACPRSRSNQQMLRWMPKFNKMLKLMGMPLKMCEIMKKKEKSIKHVFIQPEEILRMHTRRKGLLESYVNLWTNRMCKEIDLKEPSCKIKAKSHPAQRRAPELLARLQVSRRTKRISLQRSVSQVPRWSSKPNFMGTSSILRWAWIGTKHTQSPNK